MVIFTRLSFLRNCDRAMSVIVIHSTEGLISRGFAFSSSLSNFRSHRQVFSFFLSALNFWFFCFKTKELKRKETLNVALFPKMPSQFIDDQHLLSQLG